MSEFKLVRFKYTWLGAWAPNARYNPDDIVSYGGKVYTCLVSHTASTDFYAELNFLNNDIPPLAVPRWELVADGVSWKGDWTPDTYYKIGDYIKFRGTVYVCVEGHTSASKYIIDPTTILTTKTLIINPADPTGEKGFANIDVFNGYWNTHLTSKNWRGDWTPDTYYVLNDVVRNGGRTYRCNQSHLSAGSYDSGLEASIGQWDIVNIADQWTGDWTTDTKYVVNDVVKYGGIVYRCITAHKSDSSDANGLKANINNWTVLHDSTEYRQDWAPATIYKLNDVVKYGSYVWKCNSFHTSGAVFNTAKFDIFIPGQEYNVLWDDTTIYQEGDVVAYGGDTYYALSLNNGAVPSQSPVTWQLLFESSKMLGDWDSLTRYKIGDAVTRGGNVYLAKQDNYAQNPDVPYDGSSTNEDYWDLIIPGTRWHGIWNVDHTYSTGSTVTWGANSYVCIDEHISSQLNRPDDDSNGLYWSLIVKGNDAARLKEVGDIKTYGATSDSTLDTKRLPVGNKGDVLTVNTLGEVEWKQLWNSEKVYFVSLTGIDTPEAGTSPNTPWRTLRYALENITGVSTVYVRTGVFEEVLPLRVPSYVAVVGDELRSTVIKPAEGFLTSAYTGLIVEAANYIYSIINHIILKNPIGTTDELDPAFGTTLYGEVPQNFLGTAGTSSQVILARTLFQQFRDTVAATAATSISGSNDITTDSNILNARELIINNKEFIKNEATIYIENVFTDSTSVDLPARWSIDLDKFIDAVIYDMYRAGNYKTMTAAEFFVNAEDGAINKRQNMFLLSDATGLRNMTFIGLEGELTSTVNIYGTRRVTAGAYASLDPGWGPSDTSVWVGSRSPYIQNVTTFGTACIGMKVDGDLHGGGNKTIVTNDFTQILSDGIGMWCNGEGRAELVSVFVYYNHIGYLCTAGGKIRGTNGNCSYGTFGAVSEGYNTTETPITGTVNNHYYQADVAQELCDANGGLMKTYFSNAGVDYTSGTMTVGGSGGSGSLLMDEFRDGAVYEVRIVNKGDSSAEGGSGYVYNANTAQGGTNKQILLAGSDENTAEIYRQMRITIPGGTGVGQYGYIAEYTPGDKTVTVGKESKPQVTVTSTIASGNQMVLPDASHLSVGDPIIFTGTKFGNIQDNTIYYVKTIVGSTITLSANSNLLITFNFINGPTPAGSSTMVLHCVGWDHIVEGTAILASLDTTTNYTIEPRITFSSPGFATSSSSLPNLTWTSVAASGSRWVAVASGTNVSAYTADGTSYSTSTLPSSSTWIKVEYVGGIFIAISSDGLAAKSNTGASWSAITLPGTYNLTDVAYGNGTWVITASGETFVLTSTDATTWAPVNIFGGKTVTVVGDAKISNTQAKYGSTSLTLDGSGDFITLVSDPDFGYGTGDFTIEGWVYLNSLGGTQCFFDQRAAATEVALMVDINTSGVVRLYINGVYVISSTTTVSTTTWTHIAISRVSGTTYMNVAGTVQSSTYTDANTYAARGIAIGSYYSGATYLNGFVDEFRITKGVGRYQTGTSTPPAATTAYDVGTVLSLKFEGTNNSTTILNSGDDWQSITYGKGKFVAVAANKSTSRSTNGTSWTGGLTTTGFSQITYGNNRFVAIQNGASSTVSANTFDGITWNYGVLPSSNWKGIAYGQGLFAAVAVSSSNMFTSNDGIVWVSQAIGNANWCGIAFSNVTKPGRFLAVSGSSGASTTGALIRSGVTTQARAIVVAGRISEIRIWEPGSGYTSAPVMTITDPNNSSEVNTTIRIGDGVIGNPTVLDAGGGYETTSTTVTIVGNGYKDQFQLGSFLVCDSLQRLPGPGDNLTITGINDYVYKVLSFTILSGSIGNYQLKLNIAKDLGREETPLHGTTIEIRQQYSQVRLTGHDFLDIGLGNFIQTNYPDVTNPIGTVVSPENEISEKGGGRVFYTATDQDGNFRVGELFAVEQATGTVTLNAQFFELQGLEELRLGGVTVGGTGVIVREFSTDTTFTADSNNIVPTQKAIKAYIQRRVSGGGADAVTASLVAGVVQVGPNRLTTTSGDNLIFPGKVNFKKGVDGTYLAQTMFMSMF